MALTISSWTEKTVNGALVLTSTSLATTAEYDSHSLKTPDSLDTNKAWFLNVVSSGTLDGSVSPCDIWGATGANADLGVVSTSISNIVATDCMEVGAAVIDDCKTGVSLSVIIDPNYTGAPVQTALATLNVGRINLGTFGSYIINVDGGSDINAVTTTFTIVQ